MHLRFGFLLLAAFCGTVSAQSGGAVPNSARLVDRVVAIVNDEVITSLELDAKVRQVQQQIRAQGRANQIDPATLQREVLDRLVIDRILVRTAKDMGMGVDEPSLDRTLLRIAQSNGLSLDQLRDRIEAEGQSYAVVREEIRREILLQRLREREVDAKVAVSENEIDEFLAASNSEKLGDAQYLMAQLLLKIPEGATQADLDRVRWRSEQILQKLKEGADFSKTVAQFSEGPGADLGGSLGWRPADRLPKLFLDAVENLKPGELSGVLQSAAGFHIIKLLEKRQGSDAQLVLAHQTRHILIQAEDPNDPEPRRRLEDLRDRITRGGADFGELARVHSQDKGSAVSGGSLGWVWPGDTVPEFERAMVALEPGMVSEPVQSQFGWHIIQVVERKREPLPMERQRGMARQELRNRKLEVQYAQWVRELRDQAFVELRAE